ncbi:hypothetical protein DTO012A7_6745 [Penicillium roqueforti]|nr:hypothetical protein CBS147372_8355 [Penicillium roqueforti]KAI3227079.1 hypothetical protein DTO012A7_6745 [Penicillium roqueforti]KAI3267392.1 hypothetical protein CBS147309_6012 [Penicillium roqueforti]KAI3293410.1 hypothetical protein DTO002I6_5061 [Penicillium roqueforti]
MPCQFPFECEPFYMRPLLITTSIISGFFKTLIYFLIPVTVAIAIIFILAFLLFAILAALFGWDMNSEESKAKREKEREKEKKEREQRESDAEQITAPPVAGNIPGDTIDLEKRLEIEIELLAEMVLARRRRLDALKEMHLGDNSADAVQSNTYVPGSGSG